MAQQFDWSILPNKNGVTDVEAQDFHYFDLYNLTVCECLRYGERRWGINLDWGDPAKADNIRFVRQNNAQGAILYEEPVAIHVRGGGFLVYQSGRRGINLGWSSTPRFEWRVRKGTPGAHVKAGTRIGLFNTVENDFLMYEPRDWGINLKWFKDHGQYNDISKAIDMARDATEYWNKYGDLVLAVL